MTKRDDVRKLKETTRKTILNIRRIIEHTPADMEMEIAQQIIEEWRAWATETSVRLENLLRQSPLPYAALIEERERFRTQMLSWVTRFVKLLRDLSDL